MLIAKEHKKILLNLNDPERVTAIMPDARTVNMKGRDIVSVPHCLDAVRVLRNIGITAPGPIGYYYDWPGRFKPFTHQLETADFATLNPRSFILNDMGSGKTLSVLWAFDYLRKVGVVDWALVVSPLSTLERTWADEIFRNFPDMSFAVVHGTAERRMKLASAKHDVYILNHDGVKNKTLLDTFAKKEGNGLLIIDELASFRNASTDRWKCLNLLANGNAKQGIAPKEWVWGLTGTPIPNEPTDAWAQCRLIAPAAVPKFYGAFRDQMMRQLTQYKWVAREGSLEQVYRLMQPAIRFKREDCIDLPPTTFMNREVELTKEQAALYNDMVTRFSAEYQGGQITAVNEAVKLGKLLQIVCGTVYGPDGEMTVPAKPRIDAVVEVVEQSSAKVIVFVPLTGALNALAESLSKHYKVSVVHGGVSKTQRDDIFADFMQPHGAKVLVAQPGTMAHGLSLTAADTICWYAPTNSSEIYQQANARIVRPGQTRNTLIVRIQGSKLEDKMYERLERRESMQGTLLGMFKK